MTATGAIRLPGPVFARLLGLVVAVELVALVLGAGVAA